MWQVGVAGETGLVSDMVSDSGVKYSSSEY